jgi:hypothetical protein
MINNKIDIESLNRRINKTRSFTLACERAVGIITIIIFLVSLSSISHEIYIGSQKYNRIFSSVLGSIHWENGYINSLELWKYFATSLILLIATWWGYPMFLLLPSNLTRKNAKLGNVPLRVWRLFELSWLSWSGLITSCTFSMTFIQIICIGLKTLEHYNSLSFFCLIPLVIVNLIIHCIWWRVLVTPAYP